MRKQYFRNLSLAEQGLEIITKGRHLAQFKKGNQLLNLYSINDFFVEVYYSINSDKIDKIVIVDDLSRIDLYIENNVKNELLN